MASVSIRDLRNHGGDVVERAARGETITVTKSGRPVAEIHGLPPAGMTADALLERWRSIPRVDPQRLRDDIDSIVDPAL